METLDTIYDTKADAEYSIVGGWGRKQVEASVKIWETEPNKFHLAGCFSGETFADNLGTPVTIEAIPDFPGSFPKEVIQEVQNFLFLGLDIMDGQEIRVRKSEREYAHDFLERRFPQTSRAA